MNKRVHREPITLQLSVDEEIDGRCQRLPEFPGCGSGLVERLVRDKWTHFRAPPRFATIYEGKRAYRAKIELSEIRAIQRDQYEIEYEIGRNRIHAHCGF